jgi:hypothetical protein
MSLACRKAKELGYPHELWTTRLLAMRVSTDRRKESCDGRDDDVRHEYKQRQDGNQI